MVESLLNSKVYGLSNLIRTEFGILRSIWTLCLVLSLGTCFYMITNNLVLFFEFKVVPKISIKYETPTEFPTVDICNLGIKYKSLIYILSIS